MAGLLATETVKLTTVHFVLFKRFEDILIKIQYFCDMISFYFFFRSRKQLLYKNLCWLCCLPLFSIYQSSSFVMFFISFICFERAHLILYPGWYSVVLKQQPSLHLSAQS